MLRDITSTLTEKLNIDIRNLSIEADNEVFKCKLTVKIDTTDTIGQIINSLKNINGIKTAIRIS